MYFTILLKGGAKRFAFDMQFMLELDRRTYYNLGVLAYCEILGWMLESPELHIFTPGGRDVTFSEAYLESLYTKTRRYEQRFLRTDRPARILRYIDPQQWEVLRDWWIKEMNQSVLNDYSYYVCKKTRPLWLDSLRVEYDRYTLWFLL